MVAGRIRELREMQNLSQAELGKKLGITRSSVNAWEMGVNLPSTHYLIELSRIFRVTTDYILGLSANDVIILDGLSQEEKSILQSLVCYFRMKEPKPFLEYELACEKKD